MSDQKYIYFAVLFLLIVHSQSQICHYTCSTCSGQQYYQCITCPTTRGIAGKPFAGMCYCQDGADQNDQGNCVNSNQYNHNNKALILTFIGLSVALSIITTLIRGSKYFLLKIIEDVQQLSLIVFINLYFPQQFDPFMASLYRFNISSYTFEAMASGSLFLINQTQGVQSLDGSNIYGKYKLLYKTSNFFSNQFTWIIVFTCIFAFIIALRYISRYLVEKEAKQKTEIIKNESQINLDQDGIQEVQSTKVLKISQQQRNWKQFSLKNVLIKANNILWLNFIIFFFYFSLIEINVNVFTQISNLTFSSSFAATGAFFSAIFLGLQIALIALLVLKSKEQMMKPAWMRDYAYTAPIYLVRTNYKSMTKYFFFFGCLKKVFLAMMITLLYQDPVGSIIGLSIVQFTYICVGIYCQPFQRRYMRLHFYFTESMKLFMYVSLVNFTQKYVEYIQLIDITKIIFLMLTFVFGFHFICIVANIFVQKDAYWFQLKRKLYYNGFFREWIAQKQQEYQEKQQKKQQKSQNQSVGKQIQKQSDFRNNIIGHMVENVLYFYKDQQDTQQKILKGEQLKLDNIQLQSKASHSIK